MDRKYSISIVEYMSDNSGSRCGYCKSSNTSISNGMWAHSLSVQDYQDLIDRGWRRSGQYCYKPILNVTCCPLYTIKCEALNFKLSKSQKKLLKRVEKFLRTGEGKNEGNRSDNSCENDSTSYSMQIKSSEITPQFNLENAELNLDLSVSSGCINAIEPVTSVSGESVKVSQENSNESRINLPEDGHSEKKSLKTPRPGDGINVSKPQCKKAKLVRIERRQKKLQEKGLTLESFSKNSNQPQEKTLEDFIKDSTGDDVANKLELKLVRSHPRSREFEETFNEEYALYVKYQTTIHKDSIDKCTTQQFTRFLCNSPLKVRLLPANCGNEILKESWKLFVKYQMTVHKEEEEDCDFRSFKSFLVASPLQPMKSVSGPPSGYGSFHQQYWLNEQLIAVGVVDILPKCVSSVYFFYDPDYSFLSLGTYGSLREIGLVRSLSAPLSNYYMGFYIHFCPKMRYKAHFNPSYLLCPQVFTWHPIADCQKKLDISKYSRFNDDLEAVCEDSQTQLFKVLVLWKQIAMPFSTYRMRKGGTDKNEEEEVTQYGQLVGRTCAERMLLYRSS